MNKKTTIVFWYVLITMTICILALVISFAVINSKTPTIQSIPTPTNLDAYNMSKKFVLESLKSPSTAVFPDIDDKKVCIFKLEDHKWDVLGYVDAQNGFGAMIRNNYFCSLVDNGGGYWICTRMRIE